MNKAQLVDVVRRELGRDTSKAAAERALDAVLAAIQHGVRWAARCSWSGSARSGSRNGRRAWGATRRRARRFPSEFEDRAVQRRRVAETQPVSTIGDRGAGDSSPAAWRGFSCSQLGVVPELGHLNLRLRMELAEHAGKGRGGCLLAVDHGNPAHRSLDGARPGAQLVLVGVTAERVDRLNLGPDPMRFAEDVHFLVAAGQVAAEGVRAAHQRTIRMVLR